WRRGVFRLSEEVAIRMRDVRVSFGEKQVLKGVNVEVGRGEIIGYIGPNGAGKSTTIKLVLGLLDEFEGEIEVFGTSIREADTSYKKRICYVHENADVYDQLTASEYLTFVGELYGMSREKAYQKAAFLMEQFGLTEVLHQEISAFSKGMRQKVLLISSMLHNPDIIFLDEPVYGLDANSVIVMTEIFHQLAAEGKTIFYSSHIMEVVADITARSMILLDGEIIDDNFFDVLMAQMEQGSLEGILNPLCGYVTHEQQVGNVVKAVLDREVKEAELFLRLEGFRAFAAGLW